MQRRQLLQRAAGALAGSAALSLLGGCAGVGGPPVITLGEAELQRLLARGFPQQRRLLEVLQVELATPVLTLLPERNRLGLSLSVQARDRLTHRPWQGEMGFDTALRYEPRDATVRLAQVRVQRLRAGPPAPGGLSTATGAAATGAPAGSPVPGMAGAEGLWPRLGAVVAELLLEDRVVYSLDATRQADLRRLGLAPGAVTVTARGVEITLARQP